MLPKRNTLPNQNYEAKKILCSMSMQYKKIHSCPNGCILYKNEFEDLRRCPICGLSCYEVKASEKEYNDKVTNEGPPDKVIWHLPII